MAHKKFEGPHYASHTAASHTDARAPRNVHLMGICGTAMAALAGSLQALGMHVSGSDAQVYPPMSDHLARLGIPISEGYRAENICDDTDLVIVGNVIQESNPEAVEMRRQGLPYLSMAEAVNRFAIAGRHCVAVVGTHGKTTTTALAAHIFTELGARPGFLIGGIARNFESNFALGDGEIFIIEGDEYDTAYFDKTPKFFKYHPRTAVFTSLEFDHADIYPDLAAIRDHFARLVAELPAEGLLIACGDDPEVRGLLHRAPCPVVTYGVEKGADCRLIEVRVNEKETAFETEWEGHRATWRMPMAGMHNACNATAVMVLARRMGYGDDEIQRAMAGFRGVKRRQEVRGVAHGVTVIDDFAHHPTAVRLTIAAIAERYPGRRVWAVFEPRSFTARSDRFQTEFVESFRAAQRVVLAPPYRSSISSGTRPLDTPAIAAALQAKGVSATACPDTEAVLELVSSEAASGDVVLIMSNGGFDDIHQRLLDNLGSRPDHGHKETAAS